MRSEQIWNKETKERRGQITTRLRPPLPTAVARRGEGRRSAKREREREKKRETAPEREKERERARRLGFSASGNSLQSFASDL
ncbi:hypothetical protein F2Q68_00004247 [Brassica cretica]|uniref:Uncharacterized protein n=1 Tax=Brassica cretica TaxID=69181 RepID=A0A8S9JI00_BRACR|nr:hypothetical protein F2Q68_00004247 [Brassica cretica]